MACTCATAPNQFVRRLPDIGSVLGVGEQGVDPAGLIGGEQHLLQLAVTDVQAPYSPQHQVLVNTVLHHSAFTAGPLLDVLRGLCAEIFKEPAYGWSEADAKVLRSTLDQVAVDYGDLLKQRNIVVHGTWYIGYGPQGATEFPDMGLSKWKTTKDGFASAGGPRTAADLLDLSKRCDEVTKLVRMVDVLMIFRGNVQKNLVKENGRWVAPGAADPS